MSEPSIQTTDLSKSIGWWKPQILVDKLNLTVGAGQVFGLLGPNGAGKTTTFKMLLGLARISSGGAFLFGRPVPAPASRQQVGFLPEVVNHPDILTPREYLGFHGRLMEVADLNNRITQLLRDFAVEDAADRPLGQCSKGMRQRVDLARVLLAEARLILLDEPVSGLDPLGQHLLKELILRLKGQGISILLTSHAVGMLAEVCDAVGILHRGQMAVQGPLTQLLAAVKTKIRFRRPSEAVTIQAPTNVTVTCTEAREVEWVAPSGPEVPAAVATIVRAGGEILEVVPLAETLLQLFSRVIHEREGPHKESRGAPHDGASGSGGVQ
ncbi:MAG: ABC transporter ATP-binding protein [Candidatus Riflebacteria bacterium]|nr:ABC transporter ATP-binding protein [Candidatus Riflebacteria bacterium]